MTMASVMPSWISHMAVAAATRMSLPTRAVVVASATTDSQKYFTPTR
ncbi:hypothetical protein ACFWP5_06845 [Streptomyces sp. NPDC058469]